MTALLMIALLMTALLMTALLMTTLLMTVRLPPALLMTALLPPALLMTTLLMTNLRANSFWRSSMGFDFKLLHSEVKCPCVVLYKKHLILEPFFDTELDEFGHIFPVPAIPNDVDSAFTAICIARTCGVLSGRCLIMLKSGVLFCSVFVLINSTNTEKGECCF